MNDDSPQTSCKGRILAATPHLTDPNFAQTLVYIAEHTEEGALGFVMNRPVGKTIAEVTLATTLPKKLGDVRVLQGGPVQQRQLMLVVFEPGTKREPLQCRPGLPQEQIEAHLESGKGWVRAFAGYSGWQEGQLENELKEKAWKIFPADQVLFRDHILTGLWGAYMSGDDRWRKLLDKLPVDPDAN
jgi:putative transcriptional regulator